MINTTNSSLSNAGVHTIFCIIIGLIFLIPSSNTKATESFQQACVSYETSKKMFKLNNVAVIGSTCKVKIEEKSVQGNQMSFRVNFQTKDLNSGNGIRDKEVVGILGEELAFNLEIPEKLWKDRKVLQEFSIKGNLTLKTGTFPVQFNVKSVRESGKSKTDGTEYKFQGSYKGKFTEFGMEPPSVGPGGFVSDVSNDLTLRFEIGLK